ncbi:MAG: replication-associated recombination protein A [Coriobacteriia bacterium]|nr:replication-associated recombination protein A [Coriobacteriia bacterium]MBS5478704.1 replication-associated recombination protein A [Coriobacteriia bacterium]
METLFSQMERARTEGNAPLAARVRPQTLDDFHGQLKAVGPGTWLRDAIEHDALSSVILFGPAGTGKTTLARIIARVTRAEFVEVSAITGTVKDLRREIDAAHQRLLQRDRRTILFVDEIHRFSKSQQDALLHAVENRTVVLVGATTENPYFEVNQALLSRSRVVELTTLSDDDISAILDHALACPEGLAGAYELPDDARAQICLLAGGDARSALTTLELAAQLARRHGGHEEGALVEITADDVREATPSRVQRYDKGGDEHYDIVSAFIKSMRGSDPDAAVYWLARMLAGGEDPKFIARRMFILASEDVGNADPQALLIAEAAFRATEVIGLPECRINLAQAAIYLALAPKSNASYAALNAAQADVRTSPARAVPSYLRDRHRPGSDEYGTYLYPHDYPGAWVDQRYLPDGLERGCFYRPTERGWEQYRTEFTRRDRQSATEAQGPEAPSGVRGR